MRYTIEHDGRSFAFQSYSPKDMISWRMRKYGTFYERDLLEYSRAILGEARPGGLVVDIGANLGNHSVFWAAHSARHVVSIEANPALNAVLSANLGNNAPVADFTVIAGGAGERSALGRIRLADRAPDQFGLAGVDLDSEFRAGDAGVFEVHALTTWLNRIGRGNEPVRLLKIDVEGAEIPVICGAAEILDRDRPEIFAEAATVAERTALDLALSPWGYRRIKRFCSTPTWHFSTQSSAMTRWRWRRLGDATRLHWRYHKLRHSIVSRVRRAA